MIRGKVDVPIKGVVFGFQVGQERNGMGLHALRHLTDIIGSTISPDQNGVHQIEYPGVNLESI